MKNSNFPKQKEAVAFYSFVFLSCLSRWKAAVLLPAFQFDLLQSVVFVEGCEENLASHEYRVGRGRAFHNLLR